MEEKIIINKDELKKMVERYTLLASETYKLKFVYSSLLFSKSKKSFIFDYTLKINDNSFVTNKVILFEHEIKNILNYHYKELGYKVANYKLLDDDSFNLELNLIKVKKNQKVKVRL